MQIEETPTPANDDFQDAEILDEEITEEPGGNRFLFVSARGFNWNAAKELEEPDHAGDPGGASVWYSWIAPESGLARISVCCSSPDLVGVYVGGSVNALAQVEPTSDPPLGSVFPVDAGTTYRVAVDGEFDTGAGTAETGSFRIGVSMELPSIAKASQPSPQGPDVSRDVTPPRTTISKRRLPPNKRKATFAFASSEPESTFRCKLDQRPFTACRSPKTYRVSNSAGTHSRSSRST